MFARLAAFPAPVVCLVRGAAIGGGLGLTVCSDFVLAEPAAVFATSEVMLGLVPAVIGPYVVRKLGLAHAAPLMLTGRRLRRRGGRWPAGLVQRLVEPSEARRRPSPGCCGNSWPRAPGGPGHPGAAPAHRAPARPELLRIHRPRHRQARTSAEGQEGLEAFFRKTPPLLGIPRGSLDAAWSIANRGEIARRILRAGRARGYEVAVVSTPADADSPVRREADAVLEVEGFLAIPAIVEAAAAWGADLLHPGYGYLSENAAFAQAVEAAGIAFVGPSPENMRALGGKESAKALARACGVPVLEALLSGNSRPCTRPGSGRGPWPPGASWPPSW